MRPRVVTVSTLGPAMVNKPQRPDDEENGRVHKEAGNDLSKTGKAMGRRNLEVEHEQRQHDRKDAVAE